MASHLQNTTVTNFKPGLQTSDHMPRKRKRHYNKISLMLLILVGCCLTLILNPLHVQAKENNNTTSKGENMLSTDHQNHQHEQDNTNIKADETNDNGIFKRLQPSDINIEMNDHEGEEQEEEEEEELELEEDEHSTEVIEMIQPPHTLRHQEHYKQRMLQAEKHKQHKQQHQQQQHLNKNSNDGSDNDDGVIDLEQQQQQQQELSQYNRNLRYKQIQQVLREPIAFPTPHHRRHEQHLQHLAKQRLAKQTELTWPQQHHLRHQHHQHIQEFQPQLRHLKHEIRKQNATATKTKPQLHQRYFDRESSFMNPLTNMVITEGPHLRHTGSNPNWKSITYANNPHNRLFSDDSHNNEQEEDIKRFSLSLHALENEKANKVKETLHEPTNVDGSDDGDNANYDTGDTNDNNNDDYSYEDDVDDDKEINKQNNYPSISSNIKTNVKRYTNPLKPPFSSSSSSSYTFRKAHAGHHLKHTPPQNMAVFKNNLNKDNNNNNNNNNEGDGDDDDNDYDDIENNKDETDSSSDESSDDDNEDDKMSDEKWNKIEHEHYRKQLQHQRAMQALRFRRTQNDNTPHTATATTITSNKYSLYSPSAISASSTYNAGWTKRQTMNDGENDNIYSRYYVPGSVTRKKEEELGSPTAILESRRQFALQQRQNKALASAHHRRIVTEGSCRLPQPRVERIRKDSWKIYTPHCTILHRCADDAGCCPNERQTCAPKRTKNVDLFFFVISLNETQGSIEKLTFVNHTECHCIDRSKQRAPEYANSAAKDLLTHNNQIPYLRRATILNCYCPNLFEKILQEDGYCRCDCSSGNMGCDWLKRGMEHFSMNDRKCIIEGRCQLPTCEYGQYIKKHGRCPRREERHLSADIDW